MNGIIVPSYLHTSYVRMVTSQQSNRLRAYVLNIFPSEFTQICMCACIHTHLLLNIHTLHTLILCWIAFSFDDGAHSPMYCFHVLMLIFFIQI